MRIYSKCLTIGACIFILSGCRGFQPPPDTFQSYVKLGVNASGVIAQMTKCGYPNGRGFVGSSGYNIPLKMQIRADQCMLRAGYSYRSGFGGICSLGYMKEDTACKE